MLNNPLVSVVVITYNSGQYVIDTLESIKNQTYVNIELIISDDCSKDNTIEICKGWLDNNKHRFIRTELITARFNIGIPGNCNRGVNASVGKWVKIIAGDDILFENCISDNMHFVINNKQVKICQSNQKVFKETFEESNFLYYNSFENHPFAHTDYKSQHKLLQFGCLVNAPTVFIQREIISTLGGFDEDLSMEDWPFWLKVTNSEIKIYSLNKTTVGYRVHGASQYNQNKEAYFFNDFFKKERMIQKKLVFNQCSYLNRIFIDYNYFLKVFFYTTSLNRDNLFNKKLFWIMNLPFMIYFKFLCYTAKKQQDKVLNFNNHVSL